MVERKCLLTVILVLMIVISVNACSANTSKIIIQEKVLSDKSTNIEIDKLEVLTSWIGKYPIEKTKSKTKSFLAEPLIKRRLIKLIGIGLYNRLTISVGENFLIGPIEFEENFFILDYRGNFHSNEIGDSVTILINKANGDIHVAKYFLDVETGQPKNIEWYRSQKAEIPNKVMEKVYWLKSSN